MMRHTGRKLEPEPHADASVTLDLPVSPGWARAIPLGPDIHVRITEPYARLVARHAYFWAWPLINTYNKRLAFQKAPEPGLLGGVIPFAPLNRMCMLSDYADPAARGVACPNQDVIYGVGMLALERDAVVVQVPEFGNRFWMYMATDLRTDAFAQLGTIYATSPGFYLLAGPSWHGPTPRGITQVFRATTNTALFGPRVCREDTDADREALQHVLDGIDIYPLSMFDGKMKRRDWRQVRVFPRPVDPRAGHETRWVFPEIFIDQLPLVLADAPPQPGEEALYGQMYSLLEAARDHGMRAAIDDELKKTEQELIGPLAAFRSFGLPLKYHWSSTNNGAAFGTDYFTRTAIARSNILVNRSNEAKYFYQDLDRHGERLHGEHRYGLRFPRGRLPPVHGFWSLTLYNGEHFIVPNTIDRYSVGTKNRGLVISDDGSLTIVIQADPPTDPTCRANWLPAPRGEFSLFLRTYWPDVAIVDGTWTPPAVERR